LKPANRMASEVSPREMIYAASSLTAIVSVNLTLGNLLPFPVQDAIAGITAKIGAQLIIIIIVIPVGIVMELGFRGIDCLCEYHG
jgi:hypothetical protein